jgi:hypothetical protein
VLPELRVKDKEETRTITTGTENSFGPGFDAVQAERTYCLATNYQLTDRTNQTRNRRTGSLTGNCSRSASHFLTRVESLLPASKEYRIMSTRVIGRWQGATRHFLVVDWGWYQLISALADYSAEDPGVEVKTNTTSASLSEVGEPAVEWTGMATEGVLTRPRFVSVSMREATSQR